MVRVTRRRGRVRFELDGALPWIGGLAALVQSSLLSVLLTWPTVARLDMAVLGCLESDTMKHLWTLWWIRRSLLHDHVLPFATEYVNFPAGMQIWPIEPLNGLAALLLAGSSVVVVSNVLALVNLTLDGLFGALLGRELTGSLAGALAVGFLIQTSSFALFTLHVGVGELQHLWIVPLGLWALLRLARTLRWRWVGVTGAVLGFGTLACFYHGFFLATGLTVLGALALIRRQGALKLLVRLIAAAALAMAIVAPLSAMFPSTATSEQQTSVGFWTYVFEEGHGQPQSDPIKARLQPEDLVRTRSGQWDPLRQDLTAYAGGRLLGVPLVLLALAALVRRPRRAAPWLATAAVGVLFALGSYLSTGGDNVLIGGDPVAMPALYLNRMLWFVVEPIHFPVRFLALTQVALAAMGGLAVVAFDGRWRVAALVLVVANGVDVHVRQLLPYPLVSFELPPMSYLESPEGLGDGALLDLTGVWSRDGESRRLVMAAQLVHERPIQAMPVDRLQFFAREGHVFARSLKLVEDLGGAYRGEPATQTRDYQSDVYVLRQHGFAGVLVHSQGIKQALEPSLIAALTGAFGAPLVYQPRAALFAVPEVEVDAALAAGWDAEYAQRRVEAEASDETPGPSLDHETRVDTVGEPDRSGGVVPGAAVPGTTAPGVDQAVREQPPGFVDPTGPAGLPDQGDGPPALAPVAPPPEGAAPANDGAPEPPPPLVGVQPPPGFVDVAGESGSDGGSSP